MTIIAKRGSHPRQTEREKERSPFFTELFVLLPVGLQEEIRRIEAVRGDSFHDPEEVILRRDAPVCIRVSGQRILLSFRPTAEEIRRVLLLAARGSLYAYRDCLADGFLPMPSGIRVGVAGSARCESGRVLGVGDVESLLFRIPFAQSDVGDDLYRAFRQNPGGMLIFSPPGVGKTTALRALAKRIGQAGTRLVIADDRGEFPEECFPESSVSILRGYRKGTGIGIAVRTLSPEVLLVDEIGSVQEASSLARYAGTGVPLLSSAHAGNFAELRNRALLSPLLRAGVFSLFAGLTSERGKRSVRFYRGDGTETVFSGEAELCRF